RGRPRSYGRKPRDRPRGPRASGPRSARHDPGGPRRPPHRTSSRGSAAPRRAGPSRAPTARARRRRPSEPLQDRGHDGLREALGNLVDGDDLAVERPLRLLIDVVLTTEDEVLLTP